MFSKYTLRGQTEQTVLEEKNNVERTEKKMKRILDYHAEKERKKEREKLLNDE